MNARYVFKLAPNTDDVRRIRLEVTLKLFDGEDNTGNPFIKIRGLSIFDSDNTSTTIKLPDLEDPASAVNTIIPDIAETVGFLTQKMFGETLDIPATIPNDFLDQVRNVPDEEA